MASSKHSGVLEDSNSQLFQVLGFTPTLGQSRGATESVVNLLEKLLNYKLRLFGSIRQPAPGFVLSKDVGMFDNNDVKVVEQ